MSAAFLLSDLELWWVQVALLTAISILLSLALRLPAGRGKLWFWQTVLAASLLLPLLQPWRQETVSATVRISQSVPAAVAMNGHVQRAIPWSQIAVAILAAGIALRLILLTAGCLRLRRFRRNSAGDELRATWSAEAAIFLSRDVASPVTFGLRRPVVLLPFHFCELSAALQDAVLCHEVLHVRRRDWLFTVGEETIRALLWFHPAIWWVLNEIQLAREQAVDAEAIGLLSGRDQYVDALLTLSGAGAATDLAPAPSFLRKRHLKQRLITILKENSMSKSRRIYTLTASFTMLAAACWTIASAIPLVAAPQSVEDAPGVTVNENGATLVHRTRVDYPAGLAASGVQGTVQVQLKLDGAGNVTDAAVLSGPDELRKAVLRSVLDWHFSRSYGLSTRQITIRFEAPSQPAQATQRNVVGGVSTRPLPVRVARIAIDEPATVTAISTTGLSEESTRELMAALSVRVGDRVTSESLASLSAAVQAYDEHLMVNVSPSSSGDVRISIGAPAAALSPMAPPDGRAVRVGGGVQAANLITKITPVYPPLAKAAKVQGDVLFDATIGPDGHVQNLALVSGAPLLVQSAMEAASQWVYKPTLLNGQPVTILTTIKISYTLLP